MNMWQRVGILHVTMDKERKVIMIHGVSIMMHMLMERAADMQRIR